MKRLTTKAGKAVLTELWFQCPSGMGMYKPLRLLKIAGPVGIGIYLEPTRAGDAYTPIAHLHSFATEFPTISLTPAVSSQLMSLRGSTAANVAEAFASLTALMPIVGDVPAVSCSDLLRIYEANLAEGRFPVVTAYLPICSAMTTLAAYAGQPETVNAIIKRVADARSSLAESRRSRLDAWMDDVDVLSDQKFVQERVRREIEKHRADGMPHVEFLPVD